MSAIEYLTDWTNFQTYELFELFGESGDSSVDMPPALERAAYLSGLATANSDATEDSTIVKSEGSVSSSATSTTTSRKRSRSKPVQESAADQRRRWNRENARKSRMRKKFMVDEMVSRTEQLERENEAMRELLRTAGIEPPEPTTTESIGAISKQFEMEGAHLAEQNVRAAKLQAHSAAIVPQRPLRNSYGSLLSETDYALVRHIDTAKPHFVVTNPLMFDNPIIFASAGFFELTQYSPAEVIGRNCRLLQGPQTDPSMIKKVSSAIHIGDDVHVLLKNYRKDGTAFWNELFIAPLRDMSGTIVHFIGVQSAISDEEAQDIFANRKQLIPKS